MEADNDSISDSPMLLFPWNPAGRSNMDMHKGKPLTDEWDKWSKQAEGRREYECSLSWCKLVKGDKGKARLDNHKKNVDIIDFEAVWLVN